MLPHVRVGPRPVRIRRSDLDEFLERGSIRPRERAISLWDGDVPEPIKPAAGGPDDDRR